MLWRNLIEDYVLGNFCIWAENSQNTLNWEIRMRPLYNFEENLRKLIIENALSEKRGGIVSRSSEGKFGEIYLITKGNMRLAAKCPKIKEFSSPNEAKKAVETILHEVNKAHSVYNHPFINRIFDIQIIFGWPFVISTFKDGTLADLIGNPLVWSKSDRIISVIQIVRALRFAGNRGIYAHQDLKPQNIFFEDLSKFNLSKTSGGWHFRMYVGDFGIANLFCEIGKNSGSRPYMAPEQHSDSPIDPTGAKIDVFALGVILHECLADGKHPIGEITEEVWPRRLSVYGYT